MFNFNYTMEDELKRYERLGREARNQEMRGDLASRPAAYYEQRAREIRQSFRMPA